MNSHVTMYAHVDTKVGDWCLVEDSDPFWIGSCGLILRELDDHRYVVIGSALIHCTDGISEYGLTNGKIRFSYFNGWSDPEDLMVLTWMVEPLMYNRVSDKEIEKFVNMRLCGWKGSSYFEKVVEDI